MHNLSKKIILILFICTVFFTYMPVYSQITYEWELKKDGLESRLPMVFTVVQTDPGNTNNNVHQIQLDFRPYIAQATGGEGGGGLYFELYLPGAVSPSIYISNPPINDGDAGYINDYGSDTGYYITLNKITSELRWQLSIRYKPIDPSFARGVIGDTNHPSTSDTFIFIARNVTLPDPIGDDWLSKIDMTVATRTRSEYNGSAAFGSTGLSFDEPPAITITAPTIPASGILAYSIPVSAATPYATETFTASVTNDVPGEITGAIWSYEPPPSSTCTAGNNGGGNSWANKDFNCLGFQSMMFQVEETIVGTLTQKAIKYIPIVLKNPATIAMTVTSPAGSPPVGVVPQSLSVSGTVTSNDPLPEPADHDSNSYDYTNIRWEIKKDGSAIVTTFSTGSLSPGAYNIGESGRYRVTCRVDDDYGFEGSSYTDILITPVETMVFPPTRGVPFDSDPPDIDGVLYQVDENGDGDYLDALDIVENGWTGSYRLTYQNGTIPPNVAFQGIRDKYSSSDYLFLSFEVRNDMTFDDDDVIVLNFSADTSLTTHTDDRRIFIFPLSDTDPATDTWNKSPRLIEIYEKNAGGTWSLLTSDTATIAGMNIAAKVHSWQDVSVSCWDVEVQVPTNTNLGTSSWINLNDNFLFYFDVIRINSNITPDADGYAVQFSWPRRIPLPFDELTTYPFPVQLWGSAYKINSPLCKGLSITSSGDIGIDDGSAYLSGMMNLSTNNRFVARVTNTTERVYEDPSSPGSAIGDPIDAEDVIVTFKIAHWGVVGQDGDWRMVQSANPGCPEPVAGQYQNNPTCEQDVPAEAGVGANPKHEFYVDWLLSPADQTHYAAHLHQCIKVEIDSFGDTTILQTGVARNMDFDPTSSRFSRVARIDSMGFGKPSGADNNKILLMVSTQEWKRKRDKIDSGYDKKDKKTSRTDASMDAAIAKMEQQPEETASVGDGEVTSYMNYIVNGYMETGDIIIINDHRYKLLEPMGSFGYVITHEGDVGEWEHDIEGAEEVAEDIYTIEIPAEHWEEVTTTIESMPPSVLPPGICFSLHGGASIPLGTFANKYDIGYNGMVDIGFQLFPDFYIVALFAYHMFPADPSASVDDLQLITAALNLKYFMHLAAFSLGVGAGPVIYIPDFNFSKIDFGYDAKVSIDYAITNTLTLEIGAIYYSTFQQKNWFLQGHAGIIFNF
ncbi:MAG: hypothetical protein JXB88_20285 [Spirochaetales bacterium]|nr:hypothetical protein [Spirochaetales bacterium]